MLKGAAPKVGGGEREKREKGIIAVSDTLLVVIKVSMCVYEECVCGLHDVCINTLQVHMSMYMSTYLVTISYTHNMIVIIRPYTDILKL